MSFVQHKRALKIESESPQNEIHQYKCSRRKALWRVDCVTRRVCDEFTV